MSDVGIRRAMVLAAGFGTRLRPLTDELPKPLIPVLGRPLLDWILERLEYVGIEHAVLNTHHLPEQVTDFLATRVGLTTTVLHEPEILGTGGALANARIELESEASFLLHNGDVWCDADLQPLIDTHIALDVEATLLLVDHPPVNSVLLGRDGTILDIGGRRDAEPMPGDRSLTYTGIALISRRFLDRLPEGRSELAVAFLDAMASDVGALRGVVVPRGSWSDLGQPRTYLETHAELLASGSRCVGLDHASVDPESDLSGFVVLGKGAVVGAGVSLEDCIVTSGTTITKPGHHYREVLGPGWSMPAWVAPLASPPADLEAWLASEGFDATSRAQPMTGQASDRKFWRLAGSSGTAVLMDSRDDPSEFFRTIAVSRFLHHHGFGGADVLAVAPTIAVAVFEDLGDRTLKSAVGQEPGRSREFYSRVFEKIADLQQRGTRLTLEGLCPEACDRVFGLADLRGETEYFATRFLRQECGLPQVRIDELRDDFQALAEAVAGQPLGLMHRDCQSTNVLLIDDEVRFVDVQGMRLGPIGYDVASLTRDPYGDLPDDLAPILIEDWAGIAGRDTDDVRREVILAGLQRSMQALGAYAYLSRIRGKREFRRWMAPGLARLRTGLRESASWSGGPSLVRLRRLVASL